MLEGRAVGNTLVRGRYVIRAVTGRDHVDMIEDGAVIVCDGVICAVGRYEELSRSGPFDKLVGTENQVVFPGLVNAHHHIGLTPIQLGSPDLPLELWIVDLMGARAVDPYLDTTGAIRRDHRTAFALPPAWARQEYSAKRATDDCRLQSGWHEGVIQPVDYGSKPHCL